MNYYHWETTNYFFLNFHSFNVTIIRLVTAMGIGSFSWKQKSGHHPKKFTTKEISI